MAECREPARVGGKAGAPCAKCGHTNLVHGGPHNPGIDACVICTLVELVTAAKYLTESLQRKVKTDGNQR